MTWARRPVLAVDRLGRMGPDGQVMIDMWQNLSLSHGLEGIHFIVGFDDQYKADVASGMPVFTFDGVFHSLQDCTGCTADAASTVDAKNVTPPYQYWGATTAFSSRVPPPEFGKALKKSFQQMIMPPVRRVTENWFFVHSWNDWQRQAVLEPDKEYRTGLLAAVNLSLSHIEAVIA